MLTDRFGGRLVFTVLLLVVTVPTLLAGFANSYGSLLAVSLFLGLAGASFAVGSAVRLALVPSVPPGLRPRASTASATSGTRSLASPRRGSPPPTAGRLHSGSTCRSSRSSRSVFWLVGHADAPSRPRRRAASAKGSQSSGRRPVSIVFALFYFVTFGGFVAMSVYLPTLLVGEYGLTPTDAGSAHGRVRGGRNAGPTRRWLPRRPLERQPVPERRVRGRRDAARSSSPSSRGWSASRSPSSASPFALGPRQRRRVQAGRRVLRATRPAR